MLDLDRLIPISEMVRITSLSKATIYRKVADGSLIPPLKLGKHRVAWRSSDVTMFIASQVRADIRQLNAA